MNNQEAIISNPIFCILFSGNANSTIPDKTVNNIHLAICATKRWTVK